MSASEMLTLPRWMLRVRISQLVFAVIILGVSAYGTYWIAFGSWAIALFTSLATMIIAFYSILTQSISSWSKVYNYWAVLALDIFAVIFWLSSMAALAATRATFVIPTTINGCVNYGYGGECYKQRDLSKRITYVATNSYLSMMSGAAGLSAIEMILFGVTLTVFGLHLTRYRASRAPNVHQPGFKMEGIPPGGTGYSPVPQPQQQQQHYVQHGLPQQAAHPQNTYPQNTYPQNTYPQNTYPQNTYPQNTYPQNTYPQNQYPQQPPQAQSYYQPPGQNY